MKTKRILEASREMICDIREIFDGIISRFLIKTFGGQKAMDPYIQS